MIICWRNDETPSRFSPFRNTPMSRAPISVPASVPCPPMQTGAADHRGGNRVELIRDARDRLRRVQPGRQHHGRHRAGAARKQVNQRLVEADIDARQMRGLFVAAHGVGVKSKPRPRQQQLRDLRKPST